MLQNLYLILLYTRFVIEQVLKVLSVPVVPSNPICFPPNTDVFKASSGRLTNKQDVVMTSAKRHLIYGINKSTIRNWNWNQKRRKKIISHVQINLILILISWFKMLDWVINIKFYDVTESGVSKFSSKNGVLDSFAISTRKRWGLFFKK